MWQKTDAILLNDWKIDEYYDEKDEEGDDDDDADNNYFTWT